MALCWVSDFDLQKNTVPYVSWPDGNLRRILLQMGDYLTVMAVCPVIFDFSPIFLQVGQDDSFGLKISTEAAELIQQGRHIQQGAAAPQPNMGEHSIQQAERRQ